MSTGRATVMPGLSPQEAVARDLIVERVAARHHAPRPQGRSRRQVRAALLLRRLAERLDPSAEPAQPVTQPRHATTPYAGGPRPWSATPRRAVDRHR